MQQVDQLMIYPLLPHPMRTLASSGPKRVLALDGGGTRGLITLAFLERIEATLQAQLRRDDTFRLADYFDLIGGTSVGSIIAAQLAMGSRVSAIRERFDAWAPDIFKARFLGKLRDRFDAGPLTRKLKSVVGDETMASDKLKTGLCIVMKRMDTGSVWPISNNPHHPYWLPRTIAGKNAARRGNRDYKIWELIRSSTAAPTFFSSHRIGIFEGLHDGKDQGVFIDGAVSPHNNPALLLFMMAGIKGYNLGGGDLATGPGKAWPLGADNLLIISVGTGSFASKVAPGRIPHWDAAQSMLGMIGDGSDLGLTLLQWMSNSRAPWVIDRAVRDLAFDALHVDGAPAAPLLSFQRYDLKLEHDGLNKSRTPKVTEEELATLQELISTGNMARLYELAKVAAEQQVNGADFPLAFAGLAPVSVPA
jgi:uncharacterized protein